MSQDFVASLSTTWYSKPGDRQRPIFSATEKWDGFASIAGAGCAEHKCAPSRRRPFLPASHLFCSLLSSQEVQQRNIQKL